MKFPCYALILCLSFLSPALLAAASTETATAEPAAASPAITEKAAPAPAAEAPAKGAVVDGEQLPGTAQAAPKADPVAERVEQDRQAVLSNLLSKLVNSYNELNAKYADLSAKYEQLQKEMAVSSTLAKKSGQPAAKEASPKETAAPESAPAKPAAQEPAVSATADEGGDIPQVSADKASQYVKLKLNENGREVEFMLDPMYVDMNFDFKRATSAPEGITGASVQQPKDQAGPVYQPQYASQQPQQPQIQFIPYPSQQQAQQQPDQPAAQGQQYSSSAQSAPRDVIDGIYKAQKFYYEKRYNDSLRAVQASLMSKETALGYALEGSIYYTLGDMNAAVRSWRSALRLNPEMEDVRAALDRYGR